MSHKPSPAPHRVDPSHGRACPCTATLTDEQLKRPEYAVVAVHGDLIDLAHDMHERADQLGLLAPDAVLLRIAAENTVRAAELVRDGRWTPEAGVAWLEAGRAAVERAKA